MPSAKDVLRQGLRGPTLGGPTPPPPAGERRFRPAWVEIDLAAVRHNAAVLRRISAPAALCAVVKADAYGHGAPEVAKAAVAAGAAGVAVALVEEGIELKEAGIEAPVLLLSEPTGDGFHAAVAAGVTPTVCTTEGVAEAAEAARALGVRVSVHLKVDTGMHRMGAPPCRLAALARAVGEHPEALRIEGLWTHLAVADGSSADDRAFTGRQLERFAESVAHLAQDGVRPPVLHTANSAGAIAWPESRYSMVRVGIALYGELPGPAVAGAFAAAAAAAGLEPLWPVLSLKARVSAVRRLDAGERPSYGRLRPLPADALVATVPLGYADGVPRGLFAGGFEVLIGGRRRPLAGQVTMDQIVVDCGGDGDVRVGDEVVLLGAQGGERITAGDWAAVLGTISYEVLTGIGPRVPRLMRGGGGAGHEVTVSPQHGA